MSIAVVIMVASVVGFFSIMKGQYDSRQLQDYADAMTKRVNEVSRLDIDTKSVIDFDENATGQNIKSTYRDRSYEVKITIDMVSLRQDTLMVTSHFSKHCHLFLPSDLSSMYTNKTELSELDKGHLEINFVSGSDFIVEQKRLVVEGNSEYHTFVYLK